MACMSYAPGIYGFTASCHQRFMRPKCEDKPLGKNTPTRDHGLFFFQNGFSGFAFLGLSGSPCCSISMFPGVFWVLPTPKKTRKSKCSGFWMFPYHKQNKKGILRNASWFFVRKKQQLSIHQIQKLILFGTNMTNSEKPRKPKPREFVGTKRIATMICPREVGGFSKKDRRLGLKNSESQNIFLR